MNRKGGPRRKTRHLMKRKERGKIAIRSFFKSFKEGDRVQLVAEPIMQKGMFPLRFYGRWGIVTGKKGRAYQVMIKDHCKEKSFIVHPVHLKK